MQKLISSVLITSKVNNRFDERDLFIINLGHKCVGSECRIRAIPSCTYTISER